MWPAYPQARFGTVSWPAGGRRDIFSFAQYVFIITYKSILELELYQIVLWKLSSTEELLRGETPVRAMLNRPIKKEKKEGKITLRNTAKLAWELLSLFPFLH